MQLRTVSRLISLSLLCTGIAVTSLAQTVRHGEETTIQAIEQLWKSKGIGAVIRDWEQKDASRPLVADQFKKRYLGLILSDKTDFSRFFSDPNVHPGNLQPAEEWLAAKEKAYVARLDEFEESEYDSVWVMPGAVAPANFSPPPPACSNIDLELGNFGGWSTDTGFASGLSSPVCNSPYIPTVGNFSFSSRIQVYNGPLPLYDPIVGGSALPLVHPSGAWSAKIEDFQNGWGVSGLKKSFTVDANTPWLVYKYAVVLQDPGDHADNDRPFFEVKILDQFGQSVECAYYKVIAKPDPDIEGFAQVEGTNFYWRDWTEVLVPLEDFVGQTLTIHFTVGDCALGGHLGYAYIDGDCLDDDLVINNVCAPYQTITVPHGFDHYHWTGEKIEGENYLNTVRVSKPGTYKVQLTTVTGCSTTKTAQIINDCPEAVVNCTLSGASYSLSSCNSSSNTYTVSGQITVNFLSDGFLLVKAGPYSQVISGPFSGPVNYSITGLPANNKPGTIEFYVFKTRYFFSGAASCYHSINYTAPASCATANIGCTNCIKGFEPEPNKKYIVSAWVKEDAANPLVYDYDQPFIKVSFFDGTNTTHQSFTADGEIIDGWQRISSEFVIPASTVNVTVQLGTSVGTANFDDLRIYPAEGNLKTFVYDPVTLRLTAELDENNYATFYEYDEEGTLVRIKKETERGIMTMQENRNYKVKKP